jgi:hypothetical protein
MGLMKNLFRPLLLAVASLAILGVAPGRAQTTSSQTFVSANGSDGVNASNICTQRQTPCQSLSHAKDMTSAGGTVTCTGPGVNGESLGITQPLTIRCEGGELGYLVINQTSQQAGRVFVHGLSVGADRSLPYAVGIGGAGSVVLQNVKITGTNAAGVYVVPDSALNLTIADSVISNGGSGATGGGIVVKPDAGGSARVALERTAVSGNVFGIAFDGSNSAAGINAIIKDSMISGNSQDGIVATTTAGHAPIGVFVSGSASSNNAYGIRAIGPNVTVRVEDTKITGNNTGLAASGGGGLLSYGNNKVDANGSNGAFTGSAAQK